MKAITESKTPVKKLYLTKIMSDEAIKNREGTFFDESHYQRYYIIKDSTDAYVPDGEGGYRPLFFYRRNVIPEHMLQNAIEVFKKAAQKNKSHQRGAAAGPIDVSKLSPNAVVALSPSRFRSRFVYKDGRVSSYDRANPVNSMIAGYFDEPRIADKSKVRDNGLPPCRTTAFTKKNWDRWTSVFPLINLLDDMYLALRPDVYIKQKILADRTPDFRIGDSVFSTLTVNLNFRTACHVDQGDFREGMTVIIVASEGRYKGGYLGYPQYGVCVDLRHGDFILKNPHSQHSNTEFYDTSDNFARLSFVFYYREKMQRCARENVFPESMSMMGGGPDSEQETTKSVEEITVFPRGAEHPLSIMIRPETTDLKVVEEVIKRNVYQKKKIDFTIEPDDKWLDLGANIGTFSMLVLSLGATVVAYEPEQENFTILVANLRRNFGRQGWIAHLEAVSIQTNKDTKLYVCNGEYNKYRHTLWPKRGRSTQTVQSVSIWDVLKRDPDINCIKMDIEGAEIDILEAILPYDLTDVTILSNIDKMVFEYTFDADRRISRFMDIIRRLEMIFRVVHPSKTINLNEEFYRYYPPSCLVYCLR